MVNDSERYESIEMILKTRTDGLSWFDFLSDLITEECAGSEDDPCTCGLQSMGGSGGTLEQCYQYNTTVGDGLQPIDLARAITLLAQGQDYKDPDVLKAVMWAQKEIEFEDYFDNKEWEDEDDPQV